MPLVRVGLAQFIEYDGWIHIFVSRSESLRMFHADWHKTTQPPLYFVLLKVFSFLGTSRLAYRAVSIAAGLVAVFLVGRIAERITSRRSLGLLAAAGFGLSATTVIVACEVRSYMLAIAFVLVAFGFYLRMIHSERGIRDHLFFSAAVSAAIVTLYATVFFLVAAMIISFAIAVLRRDVGRQFLRLGAAFAAPLLVFAFAYRHHMWQWTHALNYMPELYFDRARDTLSGFLLNGIRQEFNLFSPLAITSERWALPLVIALCLAAAVALIVTLRAREVSAAVTVGMLLVLSAQIVVAAVLGKYPLGGHLRHQFLIFPFVVLGIVSVIGSIRPDTIRRALAGIVAVVIGVNAIAGSMRFQIAPSAPFTSEIQKFRTVVPPSTMLYLDEFSTIAFFSHHDAWDWHLTWSNGPHAHYDVTKDGESIRIVRARSRWNIEPFADALYRDLREAMDQHGAQSAGLFALSSVPTGMSSQEARALLTLGAATQRLAIDDFLVDGENLYVRLHALP